MFIYKGYLNRFRFSSKCISLLNALRVAVRKPGARFCHCDVTKYGGSGNKRPSKCPFPHHSADGLLCALIIWVYLDRLADVGRFNPPRHPTPSDLIELHGSTCSAEHCNSSRSSWEAFTPSLLYTGFNHTHTADKRFVFWFLDLHRVSGSVELTCWVEMTRTFSSFKVILDHSLKLYSF